MDSLIKDIVQNVKKQICTIIDFNRLETCFIVFFFFLATPTYFIFWNDAVSMIWNYAL